MQKRIKRRPRVAHEARSDTVDDAAADETSDAVPSLVGAGPPDDDDEYEDRLNRCNGA